MDKPKTAEQWNTEAGVTKAQLPKNKPNEGFDLLETASQLQEAAYKAGFKAGKKGIVQWADRFFHSMLSYIPEASDKLKLLEVWQAKLKEWGITIP